jgi:3-hydroxy-9,10-secoandrosta-1,3,5(10)-triene-9,17-dione monooxygenase
VTTTADNDLRAGETLAAELITRAEELRDRLLAEQAETEQRTHYSPGLHRAFEEAGFYRMYVPRRYGGLEVDVPTFLKVMISIGRGSLDASWCLCLASNHAMQVASWFGREAQDAVFSGGDFRAASVASPTVTATRVADGWRLDGKVAYCSGIPYSNHFMGQAMIACDNGAPPRMALFVAPEDRFTRLDDWGDLLGLKGTGSNTIRFDGAVVPPHFVLEDANMVDFPVEGGTAGLKLHGNPMYGGRALFVFTSSLAAPIIGGAYGALDEYAQWMRTRMTPLPPMVSRLQNADYQRWYGGALAKIATAEAALLHAAQEHMEMCRRNATGEQPYTAAEDFRLAAIAREACIQAWEAVEQHLLRTIGSSALRGGERFERSLRAFAQIAGHRNLLLREDMFRIIAAQDLGVEVAG